MASQDLSLSKPGVSTFLRAILLLFVAAVVALLVFHLFRRSSAHDAERAAARYENLRKLNEDHAAKAKKYAWLDKGKGTVQIPIADAMHIMTRELAAKKPAAAYPIATPAPAAPAPAPATAVAPAAGSPTPAPTGTPVQDTSTPGAASLEGTPGVSIPAQSPAPVGAPIQNAPAPADPSVTAPAMESPVTTPAVEAPAPAATPSSTPAPTP